MATRLRKSRRQRGTRYCGWGQIGQHRASGSRGGVGGAGKHKHFWIRTVIYEPEHFGHGSLKSKNNHLIKRWINLKDLNSISSGVNAEQKDGKILLNLKSLGFQKLLGSGSVEKSFIITVPFISLNAKTKIESAGGSVISNEHSN